MRKALWALACCGLFWPAAPAHGQANPVGHVKTVTGEATVVRDAGPITAVPGLTLLQGDILRTGARGTMGVILRDDTTLSLGVNSELRLTQFAFEPAAARLGLIIRLTRGVLGYASGKIAKLAPDAARVETPMATLGIRGTRLAVRIGR